MNKKNNFQFVDYLWDEQKAKSLGDNQVELFLYRSNILGADLRITNYGGGNTSCKTIEKDPLTGAEVEVMWVKGSGGDIGTLKRDGIAGLYTDRLRDLKKVYRGLEHEDEMVGLFDHCIYDLDSKAPSIDTPLHGLLPFKHIDHLHPDALIAIAAAKDGEQITKEIWGDTMGWVPWQRPGFDLGLQLEKCLAENPGIRGIVLGSHGLFTWGDTSYECYINSLEVIEAASQYIADKIKENGSVFGGAIKDSLSPDGRKKQAALIAPLLRGLCSSEQRMVGHFDDQDVVLEFINSNDLAKLAPMGTSCPDHFLRTKICPLVLPISAEADLTDTSQVSEQLQPLFESYRKDYLDYYENHKHPNSPSVRDCNPVIILYPGVGLFSFAKNKQTARVAAEFYVNAINVMRGAEALSSYKPISEREKFRIEYWALEEAKLQRLPKPKSHATKVAFVTGAASGIGKAIAHRLAADGAHVVIADVDEAKAKAVAAEIGSTDVALGVAIDVRSEKAITSALSLAVRTFGGLDIVVNNAGVSLSKPLLETTEADWDFQHDIMAKGSFLVSRETARILMDQEMGGDVIYISSKNSVFAGPNNIAYSATKADQAHQVRLLAVELGEYGIRVNGINPDGVVRGSGIFAAGWGANRAKTYGVKEEDLGNFYAQRTILKKEVLPESIADAVSVLTGPDLTLTTGMHLPVDSGVAAAFLR